jgi:hypothetical protein
LPDAGIVPLKRETVVLLATAVTEPPAQVVAPPGAAVVVTPAGSVSVKEAPVRATGFEFVSVIRSWEETPCPMVLAMKTFVTVGGFRTPRVAEAGFGFEMPSASTIEFAGMVSVYRPGVADVTSTVTVQVPLAGTVPPESATVPLPANAVTMPPQVVDAFGTPAMTTLTGRLSATATAVSGKRSEL